MIINKHKPWCRKRNLKDPIIFCSFILFVFAVFYHASLTPREEQKIIHDIEMFFQLPFTVSSEVNLPPIIPPVTINVATETTYKTSFIIYNVEQKNNKTILHVITE